MTASAKQPTVSQLQRRIVQLEKELAQKEASTSTDSKTGKTKRKFNWRAPVIVLSVILFCLFLTLSSVAFAVNRTITDSDTYMRTVGPVVKQPAVQAAIVKKSQEAIQQNVNVEQVVGEALPPKAQFLAGPISGQVNGAIKSFLQKVVSSPQFAALWINTNRKAHDATLTLIRDSKGDANINVTELYQFASTQLQGTPLAALANRNVPPKVGSITVVKVKWLPTANRALTALPWVQWIGLVSAVVFGGIALGLSKKPRKTGVALALSFAAVTLLLLAATKSSSAVAFRSITDGTYHQAAVAIWNTALTPFASYLTVLVTLSLLIGIITWSTTDARLAVAFRSKLHFVLGWLHKTILRSYSRASVFVFLQRYQQGGYWLLVAIPLVLFLFVFRPLTVSIVLTTTGIALLIAFVLGVLATIPAKK